MSTDNALTITDAALVLGYLDPDYFAGGRMKLDDEIVELREWDAVRVPPGIAQGEQFIGVGGHLMRSPHARSAWASPGGRTGPANGAIPPP